MVFSRHDPTEVAIQKMITAHRAVIKPQNNPIVNRVNELEIATLEKAPRNPEALERLIKRKSWSKKGLTMLRKSRT